MAKQPEDWFEEPDALPQEEEDDEIIWVSKSEIKRDAEVLKKLGAELVALSKTQLERIPLDEQLLEAILLAQKSSAKVCAVSYSSSVNCCGPVTRSRLPRHSTN